jgi:hypothetical protein
MNINMSGRSHKKHSGRTRDLLSSQPGVNGKGDADRTTDNERYRSNYDEIDWCRKATTVCNSNPLSPAYTARTGQSCCGGH